MATCPCGHPRPYADCCGALHAGKRTAATAEELMRSRYAAFARGQVDYLLQTLHPAKRAGVSRQDLAQRDVKWIGLTILETRGGSMFETDGEVTFEARFQHGREAGAMRERSRFVRHEGRWVYVDGENPG
jgi:SEC-C motif-containing protein